MASPVIIDTGSRTCRAGFAGELEPRAFVRTLTAYPSQQLFQSIPQYKDVRYVGNEAFSKRAIFKLRYPVQDSVIVNWESAELLWHHIYEKELQCQPEDRPVIQTEAFDIELNARLKMLETQFEHFHVPALYLANTASLALFASERNTGVILDCGHDSTTCVAAINGIPLKETFQRTNLAGKALTGYFVQKMMERGISWTSTADYEHANEIKEKMLYVPLDLAAETTGFANDKTKARRLITIHNDEVVFVEDEQYLVGEALFSPSAAGFTGPGLDHLVLNTISKTADELRPTLLQNIILAGGTTRMPGLAARLEHNLKSLVPQGNIVNVFEPEKRQISAWLGAAKMASSPKQKLPWLTKEVYEELGSNALARTLM